MKIGDFVLWESCPSHLSKFQRNQIVEMQGDRARLRFFNSFYSIEELQSIEPTEQEKRFCALYKLPVVTDQDLEDDDW